MLIDYCGFLNSGLGETLLMVWLGIGDDGDIGDDGGFKICLFVKLL